MGECELTSLEQAVLETMLAGKDTTREVLRGQLAQASISSREFTGVGFFTNFAVPDDAPRLPDGKNMELDALADIAGVEHGVGFILFIRDGAIDFLEGYTYGDSWPEDTSSFEVKPWTGNTPARPTGKQ